LADAHKTCLNVEQGIVVPEGDYTHFRETLVEQKHEDMQPEEKMIIVIKNLGINAGLAQLLISSEGEGGGDGDHGGHGDHHSLLGVDGASTNVIDVFHRGNTFKTNGDVFFVGPWDQDVIEYDVCALPPRGGLIDGAFFLTFRMALALLLAPVMGFVLLPQAIFHTWSTFIVGGFRRNAGLGVLGLVGSPLLLLGSILGFGLQSAARILRVADFDCDNVKFVPSRNNVGQSDADAQCLKGMYRERSVCRAGKKLTCSEENNYNIVYTGDC